jgi:excisionase family DNA binding protein
MATVAVLLVCCFFASVLPAAPGTSLAQLLDVQAVAELLNCSTRHVYRLSDAGRMPAPLKVGALVRWKRAELEEWINAGCPPVRRPRPSSS